MKRGFTLVEILIVVAIIGILASLVVPRLTGQQEISRLGEAKEILGTIRRAQVAVRDVGGIYRFLGNATTERDWNFIGISRPATTNFTYACLNARPPTTCVARRAGSTVNIVTIVLDTGVITCGGTMALPGTSTCRM